MIYRVGFSITVAEPIRRAGQEHVYEVTFEDHARSCLNPAQINNFPPSSDRGDVHQVKSCR